MDAEGQLEKTIPTGFASGKSLIIGIGNSGRSDDGLGWAFSESVEESGLYHGDIELRYQLQIEDADLISQYDHVLFVDANAKPGDKGVRCERVDPKVDHSFSTHALEPGAIVGLCHELCHSTPEAYVLLIEGREWDLNIGLSAIASTNLAEALRYFQKRINK